MRAFPRLGSPRDPRRFGPWMLQIARNAWMDQRRRSGRVTPLGDADDPRGV